MTLPLGFTGPVSGLVCGALFGFVLQRGGLGNGCRLTAQLRLKDWTVFNVMFTAIVVAASGLYLLQLAGVLNVTSLYIPTTYLWATLSGGALIGVGMGVGGYCPGTSVAGAVAGRLDGIAFFVGLILGVLAFSAVFPVVEPLMSAAALPDSDTLSRALHVPAWGVLCVLIALAVLVGWLTRGTKAADSITCAD